MAALHLSPPVLSVRLTPSERLLGLLRDVDVPLSAVRHVEVVPDAVSAPRGLRAPGLSLPGVRKVGTWRSRGRKTLVCVRRGEPAVRVRLAAFRWDELLVGSPDAEVLAAVLTAATDTRDVPVAVPGSPVLAGTLTLPDGDGPFPAVLIASGSGPLDRDSNHRRARFDVARQLAHALADGGLASLRYDKRGVGETPGDWRRAGLHDNVDDLGRALDALAALPRIDRARIVLAGHSEGADLAAALAARGAAVRGVVLLAGSATPGEELLRWQAAQLAPTLPRLVRGLLRLFRTDLEKRVAASHRKVRATTTDVARVGGAKLNARWLREFMAHDPREDLRRIAVPVLAITGAKDLQARPDDLRTVADTVAGPVETHRVPDLTHTLRRQPGPASLRAYREELGRPVDAEVLATVVGWCRRATADPPPG